jgi:hypothetical protein
VLLVVTNVPNVYQRVLPPVPNATLSSSRNTITTQPVLNNVLSSTSLNPTPTSVRPVQPAATVAKDLLKKTVSLVKPTNSITTESV